MHFLATLRERLTGHGQRVTTWVDPVLGEMEPLGGGLWRTVVPVMLAEGMEPVCVTIEAEGEKDEHPGDGAAAVIGELRLRYGEMRDGVGHLLASVATRSHSAAVWEQAILEGVEVWRDPHDGSVVLALEYVLSDTPEYTYTVRVEGWRAVDVVISG